MNNSNSEFLNEKNNVPGIVTYPIGQESVSAITKVAGGDLVGNTLVRTCATFEEVKSRYINEGLTAQEAQKRATQYCLGECASRDLTIEQNQAQGNNCPEKNTLDALTRLGVEPEQAMIVAVTANGVGFSDEFEKYETQGMATTNPEGWRQVNGCNAFFSDVEDCPVLACRLADCGDVNIEFKTKAGKTIIGLMHMTRTNQFGSSKYAFESIDGEHLPYFEFAMRKAIEHYGEIDLDSARVVLRTAIEAQDFVKTFTDQDKMEQVIPGWAGDGYVKDLDNPGWEPGGDFVETDRFAADFRGIVTDSIISGMTNLNINLNNFDDSHMLDTMHSDEHSSYERSKRQQTVDTRDLYITAHKSAF